MRAVVFLAIFGLIPAMAVEASRFDAFEYRNVGPTRGGRATAVAGTAAEPGTFYLGASGGGVWKTTDYGTTWNNVSDGYFASPSIGDIAIAQNDANIVYVGTGSDGLRSNVIRGNGMYKSIDGGDTWQHIGLAETGHIGAVEIDPNNHNIVWVAAIGQAFNANEERGLFKTIDGGKTWSKVLYFSAEVGVSDLELLPGNSDIVFATAWRAERKPWTIISGGAAEEGGIYKSVNGGLSWDKITKGLPDELIGKIDLAISPADSSIVYALIEAPDEEGGLYKSVDQGESFTQVSHEKGIRTRPFYYANLDVDPQDPSVLYVMATRYYKSIDGGESWQELKPPHGDNHDMWINPQNPQLFIQANDGGANVTFNGGKTWSTQFNQPTAELYQIEVDDQYPYWLYAGQQDNSTTIAVPSKAPYRVQHAAGWLIETGGCETGPAVPKPGNHNIVYANCKGRFGVFDKRTGTERRYYVGAANMYGNNPRDLRYRFQRVSPIHVSPHDPGVVYHASQFVHRTTNEGETWETISPDLTAFEPDKQVISGSPITRDITGEEFYSTLYSLRESPVTRGLIWVGANDGPVHVTRDNGKTWQDVTPRGLPPGGRVDAIEPSPHDPAKAYIAVLRYQLGDWKPYIYKTENYGKRWQLLTDGKNGIPNNYPTRVVREDPQREGLLFAGTEYGMFVSTNDGKSWHAFQQNLPVTPITDIKIYRGDLAISTMGRSFWVLDNITTLRQRDFDSLDDKTVLFKPMDTIRFRQSFTNKDKDAVPQYPQPSVVIDYFLAEDPNELINIEIVGENGTVVSSFTSVTDLDDDGNGAASEDEKSIETTAVADDTLTTHAGLNRYHWDMRHTGPWHKDNEKRYLKGPLAAPGKYSVRLTVDGQVFETSFVLRADPRLAMEDITDDQISRQVDLELELVALLSQARRLEDDLQTQREVLESKQTDGELVAAEAAKLARINGVLAGLETEKGSYMPPMLSAQLLYLYDMISSADQVPGEEAENRYRELQDRFSEIAFHAREL